MREDNIRDDYHVGIILGRHLALAYDIFNFAHYLLSCHTYDLCFSQYKWGCFELYSSVGWAI